MNDSYAYLDASAYVKLVTAEPESPSLLELLAAWPHRASCSLLRTEVLRAVRWQPPETIETARRGLEWLLLVSLEDALLEAAGLLDRAVLRSLDAIHLAAALALGDELGILVTYDDRMKEGAELLGLPVASPGVL